MSDEGYLQAIRAAVDDDAPRLVYADALQERGDARGELIAVQCAKSRLERDGKAYSPEHLGLLAREEELLAAHHDEWVIPFGSTTDFERGFLTRAKVDASHFYERWPTLRELPLTELVFRHSGVGLGELASLARDPGSLRSVSIHVKGNVGRYEATFDAPALFAIVRDFHPGTATPAWSKELPDPQLLPALRSLLITRPGAAHFDAIAKQVTSLSELRFEDADLLGPQSVRALYESPAIASLAKLSFGAVDDRAAAAIFEGPAPSLRHLHVSAHPRRGLFNSTVTAAFLNAPFLEQLESFRSHVRLTEEMVREMVPRLTSVTKLELDGEAWPPGMIELVTSDLAPRLREAVLTAGGGQIRAARVLLADARFERLERLTLKRFYFSVADVTTLPAVPRLDIYESTYEGMADGRFVSALRERWPRAHV